MKYRDLRDFLSQLESTGELRHVPQTVSTYLEMTALSDRVLQAGGPALVFDAVAHSGPWPRPEESGGAGAPGPENCRPTATSGALGSHLRSRRVLANLFGTPRRVALGMGAESVSALREVGQLLAALKEPDPPRRLKDAGKLLHMAKALWDMKPARVSRPLCQQVILEGHEIDLTQWPVQHCWPGDVAPLITWGLVVTRGPQSVAQPRLRQNLGIYRQQVISPNEVIMRWLAHRGGALDFRDFARASPGQPFPVAVALGADPATTLGAVTPVPDSLSEYQFAGLLRGGRTELADTAVGEGDLRLQVPATAEIILEGHIPPAAAGYTGTSAHGIPLKEKDGYLHALEGPYGDHTGYYNEQDWFPVVRLSRITHREDPIYHSTYTGKPPDEPAVLGVALNEVFVPILQKQFSEITDFYLPPEGCSYRLAVVSIKKSYPGHAKRIMLGLWSFLRQFMYTKFIIVLDDDVNIRDWKEVIWAMTTRMDPVRDTVLVDHTPIDYLDFASPTSGLGGKMGLDATHKWPGETAREWGRTITMDAAVQARCDALFADLFGAGAGTAGAGR